MVRDRIIGPDFAGVRTLAEIDRDFVHGVLDKIETDSASRLGFNEREAMRIATADLATSDIMRTELAQNPAMGILLDVEMFSYDVHPELLSSSRAAKRVMFANPRFVNAARVITEGHQTAEDEHRALLLMWNVFFESYELIYRYHHESAA